MTAPEFKRFSQLKDGFRKSCALWDAALPGLPQAIERVQAEAGYRVENAIVYNTALDEIGPGSKIKWIVIADNPGRKEQESSNRKYLVGQAGKIARNFFAREMGADFAKDVIVLNKTPVHSPKTGQLKKLLASHPQLQPVLDESQVFMANLAYEFQKLFNARVWVMGLSELKARSVFSPWAARIQEICLEKPGFMENLYLFNHFSMGSFARALKKEQLPNEILMDAVYRIGRQNRKRIQTGNFR